MYNMYIKYKKYCATMPNRSRKSLDLCVLFAGLRPVMKVIS
ncbi:hypothetical protein CLV60_11450 [Dyadobacter jiangsuensis]|uniref:Uncharacterized protein n=1 Tax=Dyadobacter jiangsuensis TaxID=1591085 RepID=A0A2P8FRA3_9BACT|nr:hypothetical protein CLV60_11450 [Dyadobacter jiangsuensis]